MIFPNMFMVNLHTLLVRAFVVSMYFIHFLLLHVCLLACVFVYLLASCLLSITEEVEGLHLNSCPVPCKVSFP